MTCHKSHNSHLKKRNSLGHKNVKCWGRAGSRDCDLEVLGARTSVAEVFWLSSCCSPAPEHRLSSCGMGLAAGPTCYLDVISNLASFAAWVSQLCPSIIGFFFGLTFFKAAKHLQVSKLTLPHCHKLWLRHLIGQRTEMFWFASHKTHAQSQKQSLGSDFPEGHESKLEIGKEKWNAETQWWSVCFMDWELYCKGTLKNVWDL